MPGERTLPRREFLDRGSVGVTAVARALDVRVLSIRRKLAFHGDLVRTVFGVAYCIGPENGRA